MKLKSLACIGIVVSCLAVSAQAAPKKDVPGKKTAAKSKAQVFKLDTKESSLGWVGKKVTGKHNGAVKFSTGEVSVENGAIKSGQFTADMKSITVEDLKDKDYNAKLVNHLRSDDFFGVDKNPTATFKITSAKPIVGAGEGKPNTEITGDLTIKGKTHPITFPATVFIKDGKATATGTMSVDRTLYDIRYGSGKFFEGLGDKMIDDHFTIDLSLVGKG